MPCQRTDPMDCPGPQCILRHSCVTPICLPETYHQFSISSWARASTINELAVSISWMVTALVVFGFFGIRGLRPFLRLIESRSDDTRYHFYLSNPGQKLNHNKGAAYMTLTKADLVTKIQDETGLSKLEAAGHVESLLNTIKSALQGCEDVLIIRFGKFRVVDKDERKGRNPATGESMMLAPRKVVTFMCSGRLRESLNGI